MTDAPIRYEEPAPRVARIVLARPDARNAQHTHLLYALKRRLRPRRAGRRDQRDRAGRGRAALLGRARRARAGLDRGDGRAPHGGHLVLFTSDSLSAADAHRLGMVNHVVPRGDLERRVVELAARIAEQPLFALRLAKEAVNAAQDGQGRVGATQTSFALHQLCHSHNQQVHGALIDPSFLARQGEIAARW